MGYVVRPSAVLKQMMATSGMTVGELSALTGLSYERTRRLLRSGGDPRLSEAFRIAALTDTSVETLFVVAEQAKSSHAPSAQARLVAPRPR